MPEQWKDIPGYEGLYQVSNLGRVRSLTRVIQRSNGSPQTVNGRILKPRPLASGHWHVALCYQGHRIDRPIHQLVMLAFVGLAPCGKECRHKNGKHTDNRLFNLCYGTHAENMVDTEGKRVNQMIPVVRSDGKTYRSGSEAAKDIGVHKGSVLRSIRLGHWCCGYRFCFLEK
jgi:hypothetical protein